MKHLLKFTFVVAAVLMLASCYKCPPEGDHVVAYTVDKGPEQRVYLVDNNEWQALLDRFCDYAEDGSEVTFYNANHKAAKSPTKETVTYSTTDREAMKRWMAQMEDEGKTVTVTYDPATGTWNGTAYANAPQPQQDDCYTGQLVYIQRDDYSDYPQYSYWGLKVSEDSIFRLSKNGVFLTTDNPLSIDDTVYHMGETVTLCGALSLSWDALSDYFVLDLDGRSYPYGTPPMPVYYGYLNGYKLTLTLDTMNHRMYCTSTLGDQTWQGTIGGGVFSYNETGETDGLGNPIVMVYNDALSTDGHPFSMERTNSTTFVLHDLWYYSTDQNLHTLDGITLHRTYNCWETWVCDTMGFNIVIHLNTQGDYHYSTGFSSAPFYVDCPTPFEAGEFHPTGFNNGWGPIIYTTTERFVDFTANYIDGNTVMITPVDETVGCVGSYVFQRL